MAHIYRQINNIHICWCLSDIHTWHTSKSENEWHIYAGINIYIYLRLIFWLSDNFDNSKIDTLTTQKHDLFILHSWYRYFNNSYTDVSFYNFLIFLSFYLNRSIKCLHKKQYLCLVDLDVVEMAVCRLRTYIIDLYSYFLCKMK
jgi:hypothetical protein